MRKLNQTRILVGRGAKRHIDHKVFKRNMLIKSVWYYFFLHIFFFFFCTVGKSVNYLRPTVISFQGECLLLEKALNVVCQQGLLRSTFYLFFLFVFCRQKSRLQDKLGGKFLSVTTIAIYSFFLFKSYTIIVVIYSIVEDAFLTQIFRASSYDDDDVMDNLPGIIIW